MVVSERRAAAHTTERCFSLKVSVSRHRYPLLEHTIIDDADCQSLIITILPSHHVHSSTVALLPGTLPLSFYRSLFPISHFISAALSTTFSGELVPLEELPPEEAAAVAAEREKWM